MVRTGCLVLAVVGLLQGRALGETAPAAKAGDVVLAADFEGQAPLEGWAVHGERIATDAGYQGGRAVMIECPARPAAMAGGSAFVERPLPVQGLRGCTLLFSAMARAEGVSARPNPWNGIKFMAPTVAGGVRSWPQGEIGVGTFDWQPAAWQTHVVAWATEMHLVLGLDDWQGLAERAARAVREIDPQRTIIVEPAPWGGPAGLEQLQPLQAPNVVYSVHMYIPHSFTHQGVYADGKPPSVYPGTIEGKAWDKATLEAALRPVADFQKAYGVHIFIGEFSAIRWAPDHSACRYLRDVIDICEAHGWDWTYHAFREWQGWSAEHGSDKSDTRPAAQPTDRQKLLCEWFAKNEKPRW